MGKVTGRYFKIEDLSGIVSLYNLITGRSRTVSQHAWEWIENPLRKPDIWVLEDEETHEIVGHHGLIPLQLVNKEKVYLAGKTENTILHPRYSGTGLYFIHEQKFFKSVKDNYDLLFTTSGHGVPGKIRKQLGYESLATYSRFFRLSNPENFHLLADYYTQKRMFNPFFKSIIKAGLVASMWGLYFLTFRLNVRSDLTVRIHTGWSDSLAVELDQFWYENKSFYGLTMDRNSSYLKWRIFDNPNIKHTLLAVYGVDGKLAGYSIFAADKVRLPKGVIVDIVSHQRDKKVLKILVSETIKYFKMSQISYIEFPTLKVKNDLSEAFGELGFLDWSNLKSRNKVGSSFMVYMNSELKNENMNLPEKWYYTSLFTEGFVL